MEDACWYNVRIFLVWWIPSLYAIRLLHQGLEDATSSFLLFICPSLRPYIVSNIVRYTKYYMVTFSYVTSIHILIFNAIVDTKCLQVC